MNDGSAPDLTPLQNAVVVAATASQQELTLYNQARAQGDVNGLTVHYQAYQAAVGVEQRANQVLAQNLVDSAQMVTDLKMLAQASEMLANAQAALKNDATALNNFTAAANAILTVLAAIAVL